MKKIFSLCILLGVTPFLHAQQFSTEQSVQLYADVQVSPAKITLHWLNDTSATAYKIYKRAAHSGSSWGNPISTLSNTSSLYADINVTVGTDYEYRVLKLGVKAGYGYINSSIKLPSVENRGKLILVVENTYVGNLAFDAAINQTIEDMEADGWIIERINVNKNDLVTTVKQSIKAKYDLDSINTVGLYLIGHVPVPYSGELNPDGHPDHKGAWPADVYYGEFSNSWTDISVNNNLATSVRNQNIPGDGKFDQSVLPSSVQLQIGRVDFANLTSFSDSEETLLINYLNKAHAYKTKQFVALDRALIDDNFPSYTEGFSASAYRNFPPMFGAANLSTNIDYRTGTNSIGGSSYMWSFGCGAGSYTSCSGIGTATDFSTDSLQTIFTMLFGSYFGDWDSDNNLLRASIAQGQTLTAVWAGRPHWYFHHMALGSSVGYSARLTQNNVADYYYSNLGSGAFNSWIHIALMGDPTVRMHYIAPPSNLSVVNSNNMAQLNWTASTDVVLGYNVYRLLSDSSAYVKVNTSIISGTSYTDNSDSLAGIIKYMVKAVDLKTTSSGSYYNQSLGTSSSDSFTAGIAQTETNNFGIYPNPANGIFNLKWDTNLNEQLQLKLFSIDGKLIYQNKINTASGDYLLNIENLPGGTYLLQTINSKGSTINKRLIKL